MRGNDKTKAESVAANMLKAIDYAMDCYKTGDAIGMIGAYQDLEQFG